MLDARWQVTLEILKMASITCDGTYTCKTCGVVVKHRNNMKRHMDVCKEKLSKPTSKPKCSVWCWARLSFTCIKTCKGPQKNNLHLWKVQQGISKRAPFEQTWEALQGVHTLYGFTVNWQCIVCNNHADTKQCSHGKRCNNSQHHAYGFRKWSNTLGPTDAPFWTFWKNMLLYAHF